MVQGCSAKKWHIPVDSNHPLQILAFCSIKITPKFTEKQSLPPAARWHNRKSSSCVHVLSLNPFMIGMDVCIFYTFSLVLTRGFFVWFFFKRECQPQSFLTRGCFKPLTSLALRSVVKTKIKTQTKKPFQTTIHVVYTTARCAVVFVTVSRPGKNSFENVPALSWASTGCHRSGWCEILNPFSDPRGL